MIYLLEDDDNIRNFVTYALNNSGLLAEGFDVPSAFWKAVEKEKPSMAILDIMLPDIDGFKICQKIRENYYFPVDPKPPAPRWVSVSSSAEGKAACQTGAMQSWATRSPGWMV